MKSLNKNQKSILELTALLDEIINKPQNFSSDQNLIQAMSSQNSLAKYSNPEYSIIPMSLNTLKSLSNELLQGGFSNLDSHRRKAKQLLSLTPARNIDSQRTKKSLEEKIALLEYQIQQYEEDLFHLSRAFWRAMSDARSYAKRSKDEVLISECAQNEEVIRGMASLMSKKVMESVK